MADPTRFGETPFIAETTTLCKLKLAPKETRADFRAAAIEGLVATSPVVWLEYLHHAKDRTEFDQWNATLAAFPMFQVTEAICRAAMDAVRTLRAKGTDGHHRVMAGDALVAATAAANGLNVLHDDKHYDKLATVLDFKPIRFGPYHHR